MTHTESVMNGMFCISQRIQKAFNIIALTWFVTYPFVCKYFDFLDIFRITKYLNSQNFSKPLDMSHNNEKHRLLPRREDVPVLNWDSQRYTPA